MDNNKCCKTAYGMEKNTANYISDNGLILTIYKELNSKKRKESTVRTREVGRELFKEESD